VGSDLIAEIAPGLKEALVGSPCQDFLFRTRKVYREPSMIVWIVRCPLLARSVVGPSATSPVDPPKFCFWVLTGPHVLTLSSSHFDPCGHPTGCTPIADRRRGQLPSPAIAPPRATGAASGSGSRSPKHVAEHPSGNDKDDAHSERQQAAVDPPAHEATIGLCRKYRGNEPEHGGFSDQQQELTNVDRKHPLLPRNTPPNVRLRWQADSARRVSPARHCRLPQAASDLTIGEKGAQACQSLINRRVSQVQHGFVRNRDYLSRRCDRISLGNDKRVVSLATSIRALPRCLDWTVLTPNVVSAPDIRHRGFLQRPMARDGRRDCMEDGLAL